MKENKSNFEIIKLLCYLGIFTLAIFIILPPLFRFLFPEEEIKEEEPEVLIMNLNCKKTEDFLDYKLTTTIDTKYVDSIVNSSIFTYEVEFADEIFNGDDVEIEEYNNLKKLDNVDFNHEDNKYTIVIDYVKFNYKDEPLLLEHQKVIADQMLYYTDNSFECKTQQVQ